MSEEDYRRLLEFYNGAAQFHALSMVAVVFGQFSILTLLQGKNLGICLSPVTASLPLCLPATFLIIFYSLVLLLGCYFIQNYMMFANLLEHLVKPGKEDQIADKLRPLRELDYQLRKATRQWDWLREKRRWAVRQGKWAVGIYLTLSVVALASALFLVDFGLACPSHAGEIVGLGAVPSPLEPWIGGILGFFLTILATLLGVFAAFRLERWREERSRRERLIGALEMTRDEIEKNTNLCKQILDEISASREWVQYYNLKTTTWEDVSPALVDLKSPELSKKIASQYYEYIHMNRKLDARFDLWKTEPQAIAGPGDWDRKFSNLTDAVSEGAKSLCDSGPLLADIESAIKDLRDC